MIIYQIYPRSFLDTNGDGIGDLQGIVKKIPYIADLGADTIWISPFFTSPMRDFGYDISDYRGVDPIFGTIADFDDVVKTAHRHGLKIMIDQVWGHVSDLHPWFRESRKDGDNPKRDWFVWSDPKEDGFFPNNWLSVFGGPAWSWNGARRQYYLHHFLSTQPALNLRNPDVFKAVMEDAWFWIERGVDGFRVDALPHFLADEAFRDNPPIRKAVDDTFTNATNPRKWQENIYTQSRPDLFPWIGQARAFFRSRGSEVTLLAEIMTKGMKLAGECVVGSDRMDTAYTGELIHTSWTAPEIRKILNDVNLYFDDPAKMCWSVGNHDVTRLATRLREKCDKPWHFIVAFYLSLEGYLCWYQGDELGQEEADIPFEQIKDPFGLNFWPEFKGRDGCRTPLPWAQGQHAAGFTTGTPWLPVPKADDARSVDAQEKQADSPLQFVRFWMNLRKQYPALGRGKTFAIDDLPSGMIGFERRFGNETVTCLFNFDDAETYPLPGHFGQEMSGQILYQKNVAGGQLQPHGVYILRNG